MMRSPGLDGGELTPRELDVLLGLAEGRSNGEIARELYLSEDTIKTHARRLYDKLGARDRSHAVTLGFARGALAVDSVTFAVSALGCTLTPRLGETLPAGGRLGGQR